MFVLCLVGVWQRNFEPVARVCVCVCVCVCTVRRAENPKLIKNVINVVCRSYSDCSEKREEAGL